MDRLAQVMTGGRKETRFRMIGRLRAVAFFLQVAHQFDIFQAQPDGLTQHVVRCAAVIEIDGHKPRKQGRDMRRRYHLHW